MRIKLVASFVILLTILFMVPRNIQGAQFVIASWVSPDENGEGIYGVTPYSNITGAFYQINNPDTGIGFCYSENTTLYPLNFTDNTALRFDVRVLFNYTHRGFSHPTDNITARNYIRVSVEMFASGTSVFYQQNMTYDNLWGLVETDIWYFAYVYVINVILIAGQIYMVVFNYDVFMDVYS